MKKLFVLLTAVVFVLIATGNTLARQQGPPFGTPPGKPFQVSYEDGTYRGIFADRGDIQVAVQFTLENNRVTAISFRRLFHSGIDYLTGKNYVTVQGIREQHQALIDHLVGEDIRVALGDLYEPGKIVLFNVDKFNDVDGFTGATLRSTKIKSAIHDGLNRGVYRLPSF